MGARTYQGLVACVNRGEGPHSGILVFATLGVYSLSASTTDVMIMYAIGVMGFFMRRLDFPIAPVILGPLTVGLLLLAGFALLVPYIPMLIARLRGQAPSRKLSFGDDD